MFGLHLHLHRVGQQECRLIACRIIESSAVVKDIDATTLRVIISRAFKGGGVSRFTLRSNEGVFTSVAISLVSGTARAVFRVDEETDR